jgi:starvation-inducible DNA-binding protein
MTTKNKDVLVSALRCLFADNFVVYYKSHGFHFNVQGQTFSQDHSLLNEIYDYLYENHDTLGEQIRQLDKPAPTTLKSILSVSEIDEETNVIDNPAKQLEALSADFETLLRNGQWVYEEAGRQCCGGLETYLGDYLAGLSKLNWKVKATLKRSL